ncbi:urate hydroxylase PuuD [Pseudaquabacterium rugosum]|uniref:Urate hydroxylase PuuD n=1 Tax=Pseudaquabacterium rugosum TaxID=2984194 RepID=A0ABU9B9W4_9BURK
MDTAYLLDWANLLLRWAHVITAIAWIGASFHFVMLDNSLTPPEDAQLKDRGVDGELWSVHGGGFYHATKYRVAPRWIGLPAEDGRPAPGRMRALHWSFWESYSTWLTGFGLFTTLYLFNAGTYLVDRRLQDWSAGTAVAAALGFLAVFWLAYDLICRGLGQRRHGDRWVGLGVAALVVGASWLACRWFPGRAAFLLVGAMLATAMSANVFFWIIPGQRTVVGQLRAGQAPDPVHGQRGKQRSLHNTYFTLPVLVAMLSNHYGWLHEGRHAWAVLVVLMAAGALIRHSFAMRHAAQVQGRPAPWWAAACGVVLLIGLVVALRPAPRPAADAATAAPAAFAAVQAVVQQRCVLCHNAQLANKGVALHTPELIQRQAAAIQQQAVQARTMPLNNATGITEDERALLGRWFAAGAPGP